MTIGETLQLFPTILPDDATDKTITWTTSNEKIAYISKGGAGGDGSAAEACMCAMKNTEAYMTCYTRCDGLTIRPVKD